MGAKCAAVITSKPEQLHIFSVVFKKYTEVIAYVVAVNFLARSDTKFPKTTFVFDDI